MRNIILPTLVFILGSSALTAQDRSFGALPLAQKPGAVRSAERYQKDTPEYQRALGIYNRLVAARGDFRYPVPAFVLQKAISRMAGIDYDRHEIYLEGKAYEICNSLGATSDAAIAFLLAHELAHYYEKHAWRKGFVQDYKDLNIGLQLNSLIDAAARETEADYVGGFLAYSAGFGLFDKGSDLLSKLYQAYNIPPEETDQYPSLSDRQAMSQRSAEKLSRLVEVFEMANLLTAIGHYSDAYAYYQYVLMTYQSREIYNNLGVTALLDALQYFSPTEQKFRLPIVLDPTSTATRDIATAPNRDSLIRQAIFHFDAAISLDPRYAPAYLNKACAFTLLKDYDRARFYAGVEAKQIATQYKLPQTALNADVLIGIIEALEGETHKAQTVLSLAANAGSDLATYNLLVLRNETITTETTDFPEPDKTEQIDNQALARIAAEGNVDNSKTVAFNSQMFFYQNPNQGPHSRLFAHENTATGKITYIHLTNPGYPGKTARQIGLGASRADIVDVYGKPGHTLETPNGQIMVYKKTRKMIFKLGADGKLEQWGNFME